MPINAQGYFNALRSYLNLAHYGVTETEGGRIVLKDKVYPAGASDPIDQKVKLVVPGAALVINLDKKIRGRNESHPLFHFLDDNAKPWSKRCDYVIFHLHSDEVHVHCIEFKSATLPPGLVDQLNSGEAWCKALHSTLKHYTGEEREIFLTKFVLSCHPDPTTYLDPEGKYLLRDHTIRHYLYQDIEGLSLDALDNTNIESIS